MRFQKKTKLEELADILHCCFVGNSTSVHGFPFGQEGVVLGIMLPAAYPEPGSGLALPGSPEMVLSKPAGGEFKCTVFCLNQSKYCIRMHGVPSVPAAQTSTSVPGLIGMRLPWKAEMGNVFPTPLRGAHGPSLFCVFSL